MFNRDYSDLLKLLSESGVPPKRIDIINAIDGAGPGCRSPARRVARWVVAKTQQNASSRSRKK
jgi:hypothetical protein